MGEYTLMLAGIVIGGIVVAGIWGITGSIKSRASRRKNERCERIIASVEEKLIDAESIVRSYRSGRLNMTAFRDALEEKIESINRLYKPGIRLLDIFFVKYTEKLVEEYRTLVTPGTPQVQAKLSGAPVEEAAIPSQPPEMTVVASAAPGEAPHPVSETVSSIQEEEPIIAVMNEAAATDSNHQLESFLEMEPDSSVTEMIAPVQESEEIARAEETKGTLVGAGAQQEPVSEPEALPTEGPGSGHSEPEVKTSFVPPSSPGIDIGVPEIQEQESAVQSPAGDFSFSGRVSSEKELMSVKPPDKVSPPVMQPPRSQHFTLPSKTRGHKGNVPPRAPTFSKEEIAQPATILDMEAETIIVDRNTIMGLPRPAPAPVPESDKKSIGITGEDVSDAFDAFFGPGKK